MRRNDVRFALNLLLNLLNPAYFRSAAAKAAAAASVQYNPAGDVRNKLKSTSLEIAFLGE